MKFLKQLAFVILALPFFLLAFVAGVAAYGLVSGFQGGIDFMRWMSK